MNNYFGGYYLLRLRKFNYGRLEDKEIYTCSDCTNDSLLGSWSFSWSTKGKAELESVQKDLRIDLNVIDKISIWSDRQLELKHIGWPNVFADLNAVTEYKRLFFSHLSDVKTFSIYFPYTEANDVIEEFRPTGNNGTLGVWDNLTNRKISNL